MLFEAWIGGFVVLVVLSDAYGCYLRWRAWPNSPSSAGNCARKLNEKRSLNSRSASINTPDRS